MVKRTSTRAGTCLRDAAKLPAMFSCDDASTRESLGPDDVRGTGTSTSDCRRVGSSFTDAGGARSSQNLWIRAGSGAAEDASPH